jgi:2-polyprenyl-6-hydroxyphenyl methylase/3-demethylubiquinone-9 3-methyltransferase
LALGGRRILAQYRRPGLRSWAYLRIRWAICPFDRILPFVPGEGRLLDVGCGAGLWLTYLALEKPRLILHGVDTDPRKLALAATSGAGTPELRRATASDLPERTFDCVTILDVLCLMSDELKAEVLRACYGALRPGGTIVVKDADTSPRWKYAPAAIEEAIAVHVMKLTHGRPHFQSLDALCRGVAAAGFTDLEPTRIDRGYLHPHVVVRARKPRTD